MKTVKKMYQVLNHIIKRLDEMNLWWCGLLLLGAVMTPVLLLGEGSVFEIHDQLDETLLSYVLNARHLGSGAEIFPEPLGGVNVSGMQPSAILFVVLYRIFPVFTAFVIQYLLVTASGFFGMYICVRELTGSSIIAVMTASIFCLLPAQPVYGLSVVGVPLLFYAILSLFQIKKILLSCLLILYFGLTTHLVLIGYVVLSIWAVVILVMICKKRHNKWIYGGFVFLTGLYSIVNYRLFYDLLSGSGSYVSHREELVNYASPVWQNIKNVLLESAQHAPTFHKYLILPVILLLVIEGFRFKKLSRELQRSYLLAVGMGILIIAIAVLFGLSRSEAVVQWKNQRSGFLRYFQLERYYWLYPSLWYLEAAVLLGMVFREKSRWLSPAVKCIILLAVLFPTITLVKKESIWYMNVNQWNNGSGITGYISWESYYAEDLMEQIDTMIGRDKESYRIAHLGISPAPSLMYGFYTIDGYSNNYPLEYKQAFRNIIASEIAEDEAVRLYFDEWGSRCYLFNSQTGTYTMLPKNSGVTYAGLTFDMEQMKQLGCEYLFSGGEILDAEDMGLVPLGYFATEKSYWGIWVYRCGA